MAIMTARRTIIVWPVHRMALVADGDIRGQAIMRGGAMGPGLAGGYLAAGFTEMALVTADPGTSALVVRTMTSGTSGRIR